jgi:hypothetical protein
MIEAIIQAKFKNGPGCRKVRSGDYELFDPRTECSVSGSHFFGLVPGSYITMTIIIGRYRGKDLIPERCTRAGCRSSRIKMTHLGIATWYVVQRSRFRQYSCITQYGMPERISTSSQSLGQTDEANHFGSFSRLFQSSGGGVHFSNEYSLLQKYKHLFR